MTYLDPEWLDQPDAPRDGAAEVPARRPRGRHSRPSSEPPIAVTALRSAALGEATDPSWIAGDPRGAGPPGRGPSPADPVESPAAQPPGERPAPAGKAGGRAGRNLPAAVAVGVGLSVAVLTSLLVWRPAFLGVVAVAGAVATWELARATRGGGARVPLVPLLAGGPVMVGLAWVGGPTGLPLGLVATVVGVFIWRLSSETAGYQRDVTLATLIAIYVPFLASFAVLLARPEADGHWRVLVTLAGVVLSDTGGYAVGVLVGRHPMAPRVSPKKSWEGLAGSLVCTGLGSSVLLHVVFDVGWWQGAIFGFVVSAAAVLGDLAESLIKRDLGVKDMSNLLPGHGGLMDRLDSILLAAPVGYAMLQLVAPATA